MGKKIDVSVVIPCYNQEDYLHEAIESLSKQNFKNFETIIVNDGSTDNSLDIANKLANKYKNLNIKIIDQKNCGLSCARNRGIKEAKALYILPLDADDKLDKDALFEYFKAAKENPDADIFYADTYCFGEVETLCSKKESDLQKLPYANQFNYCALYKKSVWSKVGGYRLNMDGGYEDWEFWISCWRAGIVFYYIPKPLFIYRVKKSSMVTEAIKIDEHLKNKIVLNHTDLYPLEHVENAIADIYWKEKEGPYFFYSNQNFPKDKNYVLLEGSFTGYQNFGDILQLKEAIKFHKNKTLLEPVVLCFVDAIRDKKYLDDLYKYLDVEYIIFYSSISYDMSFFDLHLIKDLQIDTFHIYGGGFLNRYWQEGYLNLAKSIINFFKVKKYFFTGQQIDQKIIGKLKNFFAKYPPLFIGCRDKISYSLAKKHFGQKAHFSFDDAFYELKDLASIFKKSDEKEYQTVLLHLNLSNYVVDDKIKEIINEYLYIFKVLKQRYKKIKIILLNAYNNLSVTLTKDVLFTIQYLEDYFDFEKTEIVNLANIAMQKGSSLQLQKEIDIGRDPFMITASYHVAMFGQVLKIPVYMFEVNDYYRQKKRALGIESLKFEKFLDKLEIKKDRLREYQKSRELWDENLLSLLLQDKYEKIIHSDYINDFKYKFPFYTKAKRYDLNTILSNYELLLIAWKDLEFRVKDLKEGADWFASERQKWENRAKELEQTIKYLEKRVKEFKEGNEWLESQRKNWENRAKELQKSTHYLEKRVKEFKEGNEWLEGQRKNWEDKAKELQQEIVKFKEGNKWLESQRKNWEDKAKELQKSTHYLEKRVKEFKEGNEWLEGQRKNWEDKAKELQQEIVKFKEDNEWLESQRRNWENKTKELQQGVDYLQNEINKYQEGNTWLENERKKWEERALKDEQMISNLTKEKMILQEEIQMYREFFTKKPFSYLKRYLNPKEKEQS